MNNEVCDHWKQSVLKKTFSEDDTPSNLFDADVKAMLFK